MERICVRGKENHLPLRFKAAKLLLDVTDNPPHDIASLTVPPKCPIVPGLIVSMVIIEPQQYRDVVNGVFVASTVVWVAHIVFVVAQLVFTVTDCVTVNKEGGLVLVVGKLEL